MITVNITGSQRPTGVYLRYAHTFSTVRRDFRYARAIVDDDPCKWPEIKYDGICISYKHWHKALITEEPGQPGIFKVKPPQPEDGHWTGYYV